MAKYFNNKIKSGKLAGSVFAVRYGEVIERAYNPIVSNPKSPAQVESRAKLKLLSQMAAVMAPFIAIKRVGSVSSRNFFTKFNYAAVSYADDAVDVNLSNIKLTSGVVSLPSVVVTRESENLAVSLSGAAIGINRVVYIGFIRDEDGTLRALSSVVVSTPGESNSFPGTLYGSPLANREVFVYAYGVRDNTENASVKFGNMSILTAEAVAKLIVSTTLTEKDVTLTETRFVSLLPAQ